jgi:glycosyltransferase involved in cell wall biosynthesis
MPTGTIHRLSAVLITKNEGATLAKCLASLQGVADEIVVADSNSTDNTAEICAQYGVRFFPMEWMGYARTKNYANSLASHNWILSIDGDEVLSEELRQEILLLKESGTPGPYRLKRLTNYCGQWVRHGGWYPDVKLRLFLRTQAEWQGDFVHEELVHKSPIGEAPLLKADLLHYSFRSLSQHIQKIDTFSTLAAKEMHAKGKRFSWWRFLVSPPIKFLKTYFFKLGFLDGMAGFHIAMLSAFDKYVREGKLWYLGNEE